MNAQGQDATVDRNSVYKASHAALKGRITSVPEACHLVLSLPTVLISRGNIWLPISLPGSWDVNVPRCDEARVLQAADRGEELDVQSEALPAAFAAYASRPVEGTVSVPVEGSTTRALVEWQRLTLFDYAAGVYKRGKESKTPPAIVGFRTINPDKDGQLYYFKQLLLHVPWRAMGELLLEEDEKDYRRAFERTCAAWPQETSSDFLRSVCFPRMRVTAEIERDLAKLSVSFQKREAVPQRTMLEERPFNCLPPGLRIGAMRTRPGVCGYTQRFLSLLLLASMRNSGEENNDILEHGSLQHGLPHKA